jgi:DNA invertase Pin-like site-specific DNA recombinase
VVVAVYEDLQRPGKKHPALDRLLADAKNGVVDLIAAYDMARLERSGHALADIVRVLDNFGVGLVTAVKKVDTQTPHGRLLMVVLTAFVDSCSDAQHADSGGAL